TANYSWPFYPIANQALYGYDQAADKSFKSEKIPNGVRTQVEDGIQALFVPAGEEVDLGDFAGTCISNPFLCQNFTVSFLFKTGADKDLKVLNSGLRADDQTYEYEYGWSFEISPYSGSAKVTFPCDGAGSELAARNSWIQIVFTFDYGIITNVVLYQNYNGTLVNSLLVSEHSYVDQDRNTRLKLGSTSNTKGFFISNLNFIGIKLSVEEIQELGNRSFKEGLRNNNQPMEAKNVTIEILEAQVIIPADAGMAVIRMRRQGFLAIATAVNYDMKSFTAEANKHYKAAAGEQLAFAPGEIYKEVKIGIINMDNSFEGNKTFQVIFSRSQRSVSMKGPQQVNVTIMYTKGTVRSKAAITDGMYSM
ncbi:unnamed protein product, partial [Porites evermanni]